uniref:Putative odorant binding protein 43 n=1 Tax=Nasonia vitripennis TaxID=7425 RepID=G8B1P8_NASVI|nr:putative odorant binding protein 43 [Nasonia vitripennis]
MKTFAVVLVIGFALQVSNALMPSDLETVVETCLVENEFTSSKDDVALVDYIGKPEGVDKLKDVPREKLAAVLACMYHKQYKNTTLYDMLKYLTEMDDKVTKDQYQQMKETLTTCVQQCNGINLIRRDYPQGNDVELLKCVKAVDPPFDYLIATLRDLGEEPLNFCYERCGLKILIRILIIRSLRTLHTRDY